MSHGHEMAGALLILFVSLACFLGYAGRDDKKTEKPDGKRRDFWGGWKWH